MREISTDRMIEAPPPVVWNVLADLESYAKWNPHVTDAIGTLREGEELQIEVQPTGSRSRQVTVTVTDVESPRRLEWVGSVPFSWLFEGRHVFYLEPIDGGRTRFFNCERLSGLLVPFVVDEDAHEGYESMNEALAWRAEERFARVGGGV